MRYNVDDDWFADPTKRRAALIRRVRDLPRNIEREADGLALDAWRLAARYWKDGKQLIPKDVWERADLGAMIDADLAVMCHEGVYVRGIERRGEYLLDRKEAGSIGGRASAESRKQKYGSAQPLRSNPEASLEANPEANLSASDSFEAPFVEAPKQTPNVPKPPSPSPSPSPSQRDTPESGGAPSPFDRAMAIQWGEWARSVSRTVRPDTAKWAVVFRLLREKDGFSESEIEKVFAFVKDDDFWKDKAASAESLRMRGKNGLKKFENILSSMRVGRGSNKPQSVIPIYTEADRDKLFGD